MTRQFAADVSGAPSAGRRSRSPGSTAATSAQLRRSVMVTREVLHVNASVDCDGAAAREVQYLRQRSELLEGRLEQGRQGVLILENEISSLINHGQRSELEARLRDEQAMEMAHNRQIAQVSAMLQHATREMEESDI